MPMVRIADGRRVHVDDARFAAFNHLAPNLRRDFEVTGGAGRQARDTNEAISFAVAQLAFTEQQVFERLYTPMQYEQLIPLSFDAGEWATSIRFEVYDYTGQGKRSSGKGRDINLVGVAYAQVSYPVLNGDIGYDYNMEELRQSAYLRKPVNETKLAAAVDGYRRHMNFVGLYGETSDNVTGLLNNAFVPHGNAPTGSWNTATPAQILADLNSGILGVWQSTNFNDMITDVGISPAAFAYISSTPRSDNSDKTILQYLLENNIAKTQRGIDLVFTPVYGMDTAGVGATRRALFYVKSPLRLVMHVPLPLRFLAPQFVGLAVEVPGEYKYSGVEWRYPKSAYYMDGI